MTEREFIKYKKEYLKDLHEVIQNSLDNFSIKHSTKFDTKLNKLVETELNSLFNRIKALTHFPDYRLPE